MPVYGYKCSSCGFEEDIIQKMSDKPLTKCPKCGKDTFVKQLSAPGFELKGKGWAATDFNAGHTGVAAAHTQEQVSSRGGMRSAPEALANASRSSLNNRPGS